MWRWVTNRIDLRFQAPQRTPAARSADIHAFASEPVWPISTITMLVSTSRGSLRRGSIAWSPSGGRGGAALVFDERCVAPYPRAEWRAPALADAEAETAAMSRDIGGRHAEGNRRIEDA